MPRWRRDRDRRETELENLVQQVTAFCVSAPAVVCRRREPTGLPRRVASSDRELREASGSGCAVLQGSVVPLRTCILERSGAGLSLQGVVYVSGAV